MTKIAKKLNSNVENAKKQYVWAIMLAPNFKKLENPDLKEPAELPYAVLFGGAVPDSVKTVYVGNPFTDATLARQSYQETIEDFRTLFGMNDDKQ